MIRNITKLAACVAVCFGLSAGVCSAFDYSSAVNALIQFNGDGTFTFAPGSNNVNVINGTAAGLFGEITGTYTIGEITTSGGVSTASVSGTGTFVIHDGANDLVANLQWVEIDQVGSLGLLNTLATINMSGITYSGSNPDLLALKNAGSGVNTFTFQFIPAVDLASLATSPNVASFSGSIAFTTPPPCNCTLTFVSPPNLTNCVGDTIPDIVAVQDCGGGLSNTVPTKLVGAVTNGSCPMIIVRTNSAMDACGNMRTFVQTITVNCRGGICGHVFADCDGSGDLTAGDAGLPKVTVTLLDASNHIIGTQVTDANGGYCFTNLMGGNYVVSVSQPSGYCQTAASTSYHWKDNYGRDCWQENDGYIHCKSSGVECWWDKGNCCHWKDNYGRDCWNDKYGSHCQSCNYQSCNAQSCNNKLSVSLTNCTSQTDVDFAYTGSKPCVSVSVCAPSYVRCGQSCTYTCTVTNTGNACFTGGTVCHQIGNCGWYGWNGGCTTVYDNCPPLKPGQSCTFTHKCTFYSWNCGTMGCQSTVTCSSHSGNSSCQSSCYSQCGW